MKAGTTLEGSTGQIHATSPFHPGPGDSHTVRAGRDEPRHYPAAPQELSFTGLTRHINAVLRGEEEPRLLAADTTPSVARGLNDLAVAADTA